MYETMRLLGTVLSLLMWMAMLPVGAYAREEIKVSMEDVLKEIGNMRRELRELKIQRERDQRVIEELRRIVENSIPTPPLEAPRPNVAPANTGGHISGPEAKLGGGGGESPSAGQRAFFVGPRPPFGELLEISRLTATERFVHADPWRQFESPPVHATSMTLPERSRRARQPGGTSVVEP
jgi:hypothetical protein